MNITEKAASMIGTNPGISRKFVADGLQRGILSGSLPAFDVSIGAEASRKLDSIELSQRLESLEAQNLRLQALVCHLLLKNEELRNGNPDEKPRIADTIIPLPADHESVTDES